MRTVVYTILLCCGVLFFEGCGRHNGQAAVMGLDTTGANYSAVQDSVWKTLCNAAFAETFRVTAVLNFSDSATKDTFILTIPIGPISKTKTNYCIKTASNKVIFTYDFATNVFVRGIFEPDTIPQQDGQEVYDKYMAQYLRSLKKEQFEAYAIKQAKEVFEGIVTDRSTLAEIVDTTTLDNAIMYKEVMANPSIVVIYIPCFGCDEGGSFYCYSPKEGKAVLLFSSDY